MVETKEKLAKKVYCSLCKRKTNHGVLKHHREFNDDPRIDIPYQDDYYISVCLGCDNVNFVNVYHDQNMVTYDPYEEEYENFEDVKVYPPEPVQDIDIFNSHKEKKFNNLPTIIKVLYKEVVKSYNTNLSLLSAIGLRMIVEGVCKDLGIKNGYIMDEITGSKKVDENGEEIRSSKLVGQINGMIEKGVIVQSQSRILHQIRELGNQTAHELKRPNDRTLSSGIEIIESILHIIYELDQFNIMKK
jgi:hypothetical protein